MIYKMNLNKDSFERIKDGLKTIEFRLYDEKRSEIKVGDKIQFFKLPELQEMMVVEVLELYREKSFKDLFRKLYRDEDKVEEKVNSMYEIYSLEDEEKYGVIGIKIDFLTSGFRYVYNKLVRDRIPENIDNEEGRKSKFRILNDEEYLVELNKKVLEEALEFVEENSMEELGDLLEVLNAIMKLKGYDIEEVYKIMKLKGDKKGAFNDKIFLEYVDEESENLEESKKLKKFLEDNK